MSIDPRTEFTIKVSALSGPTAEVLECPICRAEGNLHHGRVTTYTRPMEDSDVTVVTQTNVCPDEDGVITRVLPSSEIDNPSSRRDGIAIDFSCEQCNATGANLQLVIVQHKGYTYIKWRTNGRLHGV